MLDLLTCAVLHSQQQYDFAVFYHSWLPEVQDIYYQGSRCKLAPVSSNTPNLRSLFNAAAALMTTQDLAAELSEGLHTSDFLRPGRRILQKIRPLYFRIFEQARPGKATATIQCQRFSLGQAAGCQVAVMYNSRCLW